MHGPQNVKFLWFTTQKKVFNLRMAHERVETCHWDKLCNNILVPYFSIDNARIIYTKKV